MDLYDLIDRAMAFRRHQAPVKIHLPLELRELQRETQDLATWVLFREQQAGADLTEKEVWDVGR